MSQRPPTDAKNGQAPAAPLLLRFAKKLAESGLTAADAKLLHLTPLTRDAVKRLSLPAFDALRLPYFTLKGKCTDFYRLRYLEPTNVSVGFGAYSQRDLRYVQPVDTLNEVYAPPLPKSLDVGT